jgi:uncharacterized membrane protein YgcG
MRLRHFIFAAIMIAMAALPALIMSHDLHAQRWDTTTSGKSMALPRVDIDLEAASDASLTVTEDIDYELRGSWHGLYRDVPLAAGMSVAEVAVLRQDTDGSYAPLAPGADTELGSEGAPQTYGYETHPDLLRIVWHVDDADLTARYRVVYRILGAVSVHPDRADLLWTAWGDTSESGVEDLRVSVKMPARSHIQLRAGDAQNRATLSENVAEVRDLPAGHAVQIRADADAEAFTPAGQARKTDPVADDLARDRSRVERHYRDQAQAERRWRDVPAPLWSILFILTALPSALAAWLLWSRIGRETAQPIGYRPTPPQNLGGPVAGKILGHSQQQLLTATILDLVRKDRLRTLPAQTGDTVDIALTYPRDAADFRADYAYETPVLSLVSQAIEEHKDAELRSVPMGQMRWENDPEAAKKLIDEFERQLTAQAESEGIAHIDKGMIGRILLGGGSLLGLMIGCALFAGAWEHLLVSSRVPLVIAGSVMLSNALVTLACVIDGNIFWRYDSRRDRRRMDWIAFENYFDELAHMQDEQPASIEIWEALLVYATAFGRAEAVLENMHYPAQAADQTGHFGYRTSSGTFEAMNMASLSALSSSASLATAAGRQSSSSGGGGGFSSGGGGGGGTGGW